MTWWLIDLSLHLLCPTRRLTAKGENEVTRPRGFNGGRETPEGSILITFEA